MKATHRDDILTFATFDESRDLDFNGWFLARPEGGLLVDPVAMNDHDRQHLEQLGGVTWIVLTNSDHVRDAATLASSLGAKVAGPGAERDAFPIPCDAWLTNGDERFVGLEVIALDGSKTPGELALIADEDTLITGDLIRGQRGGALNLLPDAKLKDREAALRSVAALAEREAIRAVLVGDGWPVFREGHARLRELVERATSSQGR